MKVSVITNRGVGIVRSAANRHEKCEIVDAVSSTHFENTASELATKPLEWFDGVVGTITMVRAGNGSLKVSVSFPATSYAQPLKSVGIRVKAQGDDRAHVLYAVSDGNTAIALNRPYTCDYEIPINVSSDTIEDVGSAPVPGLEDYYTKTETDTAIGNAITALNLGAASQKGVDTSIGDASSSNLPTSDAVKAYVDAHSGGGGDTSNLGASLAYDSNTKKIELKNTSKEVISSIDATAFVKDGMLDSVTVSDGNLNFVFNTDAGKETISIPMSSFFDASAYYTKSEVDLNLANYYTRTEINDGYYSKYDVNGRLNNYYTKKEIDANHYTKTEINDGYYTKTEINNKGYCTEAEVDVNHYTKTEIDTNLQNYYTKTEINNKGYCTEADINANLENYYTKPEIAENYYTKSDINVGFYSKEVIDIGYYRRDEVDDKLRDYYPKSECYSKSEIDGGYIANASYNNATNTLTLSSKDGSKQINLDLS